jgi:hypothetical protein
MLRRVTIVVLCEDEIHESFASAFLNRLGLPTEGARRISRAGSKEKLFSEFAVRVRALRKRHAQTRLLVLVDGDELTDELIRERLRQKLRELGEDANFSKDPVLVLCPRWELENWVLCLLGESVGEERHPGLRERAGDRVRPAARALADFCLTREPPAPSVPSLAAACEAWLLHRKNWRY